MQLKKTVKFTCPVCSGNVILKIGSKRIPHFAHVSGAACTDQYDRESEYHMLAKLKLFDWLYQQGLSPVLEPYYSSIKQRADIAFKYGDKMYCIEFQCSTISEEIFRRRTEGYRKIFIHPIWILAGKGINRKNSSIVSLSSFHYLFANKNSSQQWYIPSYCPLINQLIFMKTIIPVSIRNSFFDIEMKALERAALNDLLNPGGSFKVRYEQWSKELKKFKIMLLTHKSTIYYPFLRELYQMSLNPQLLPPFVGVPLKNNLILESSPFIWQTYLYVDHLHQQPVGKHLSASEILETIGDRVNNGGIKLRNLPNIREMQLPELIYEYLIFLVKIGILQKIKDQEFVIAKSTKIAATMDEWKQQENDLINCF